MRKRGSQKQPTESRSSRKVAKRHPFMEAIENLQVPDLAEAKYSPPISAANLRGKRVGMVVFSSYPADPRPRRAAEALVREGMHLELICEGEEKMPRYETACGIEITRLPIQHHRGGKVSY